MLSMVAQIKFLKTKEGCAMVQMGDALAVERAVANLNNTTFFGCKMQLGFVSHFPSGVFCHIYVQ